jgi:hypothetical protein
MSSAQSEGINAALSVAYGALTNDENIEKGDTQF